MAIVSTTLKSRQVRQIAAILPGILSGRLPDRLGIMSGFRLRIAAEFLSKVEQAFLVKSQGGVGSDGISWPPLTREYLAYGRRFGTGEKASLKKAAGLGSGNNQRGLLTKAQDREWKRIFARSFKWLAQTLPIPLAKARAAQIAWAKLKQQGARTKLDVFGSRKVEILRDSGVLFNSLSPGTLASGGNPQRDQVVRINGSELLVGTSVPYAAFHHAARSARRRRQLWPETLPPAWAADIQETAESGIARAVELLTKGRAA